MRKKAVLIDGRLYESIFSAAIDYEFSFSSFAKKLSSAKTFPMTYNGHEVILIDGKEEPPAGGIKTGKEADK